MIERSDKWQMVEEKMKELRELVEKNWDKGEWELAVFGESTIRTVEQAKITAENMRQSADDYVKTMKEIGPNHGDYQDKGKSIQ